MSTRDTKRGLFIVMEGMDGSGKSVGTAHFATFLKDEGLDLVQTREIGGTPFGEKIRGLIFNSSEPVDPTARFLACLASRQQHVMDVIKPNIEKGVSVLSDRFFDSTFVYQALIDNLQSTYYELAATQGLQHLFKRPDITIFFRVDPDVAHERGNARTNLDNDQYKRNLETARKVARGYDIVMDRLSIEQRKNSFIVNGNQSVAQVTDDLRQIAKHIVRGYLEPQ